MTGQLAGAISGGLTLASMIVRVVHDMVRDAIADVIGKLTSKAIITAVSLGTASGWAITSLSTDVTAWATRLSKEVADVVTSAKNLKGLLSKANRLFDDVAEAFNRIPAKVSEAVTTKVEAAKDLASSLSNPQYALAGLPGLNMRQAGDMGKATPTVHRPSKAPTPPKTPRPNPNEGRWGRRLDEAPAKSDPKPTTGGGEGTPPKGGGDEKGGDGSDPMSGPVVFKPFKGASETDIKALHEYVAGCNQALREGKLSPTGRVATKGTEIDRQAKRAARQERRAHPEKYPSPDIVAGHVPDSTWLGHGNPPRWQAMSSKLNSSLAGQNNNYPVGYKPTEFLVGEGD